MADNENGLYLIAYDIANPKRLSRVHRCLKKLGLPVQYSVFTVVMKRKSLLRLLQNLNNLLALADDDVRCYRLSQQADIKLLGKQFFPDDVLLFKNGVNQIFHPSISTSKE